MAGGRCFTDRFGDVSGPHFGRLCPASGFQIASQEIETTMERIALLRRVAVHEDVRAGRRIVDLGFEDLSLGFEHIEQPSRVQVERRDLVAPRREYEQW